MGVAVIALGACSTNPATGQQQFTGLMSPQQEQQIGAQEHQNALKQFGGLYPDQNVQNYVSSVGNKLVPYTERQDVQYKFFVLDSPDVNAFAIPGGYVYVTRGLLSLVNSEAELAAVLGHEIGHITGRHSAERYSRGVVTGLGAAILGAAIDNPTIAKAANVGGDLYLRSYSRGQENQSDDLGIRYIARAGYDPYAMSRFLDSLARYSQLESQVTGISSQPPVYLSTHPLTQDRVVQTSQIAANYAIQNGAVNRDTYLRMVDGLIYGDSPSQGFIRGQKFIHPELGFTFTAPQGFQLINQPDAVIAKGPGNALMILDYAKANAADPAAYLQNVWLKGAPLQNVERVTINGMNAATASFTGSINNVQTNIQAIAIQWGNGEFFRFQIAIPPNTSGQTLQALKTSSYSFRRLNQNERQSANPLRVDIVRAGSGDTVNTLARQMNFDRLQAERFMVLNSLKGNQGVRAGELYKVVR